MSLGHKFYTSTKKLRDAFFMPYIKLLAWLKVKPNWVSYLGILLMAPSLYYMDKNLALAMWILLAAKIQDMSDGALARYTKTSSPEGERVDMLCDQIIFSLAIIGSISIDLIPLFLGIAIIFLIPISKAIRSIFYKSYKNFNKKFNDMSVPIWLATITYFIPVSVALGVPNYGKEIAISFVVILLFDIFRYSLKIALKRGKT